MTILSAVRDRVSGPDGSADPPQPPGDTPSGSAGEAGLPFAGYDSLDDRDVVEGMSGHSQVELEAVERYELSHQRRVPVLDKLRYMRQPEPFPGYDSLGSAEILAALKEADMATIKKVRGYERKFANRSAVMEEVVRLHHRLRDSQPAVAAPGYQPLSARL